MKVELITGVAGQDGSYLAELLPAKGYEEMQSILLQVDLGWERHVRQDHRYGRPSKEDVVVQDVGEVRGVLTRRPAVLTPELELSGCAVRVDPGA